MSANALRLKNRARLALRRGLCAIGANHAAAVLLLRLHDALDRHRFEPRKKSIVGRCEEAIRNLPGQLFRLSGYLDDTAPCPHCGKPEALVHLATLKTYCWGCSYWGHDPRVLDEDEEPAHT